VDLEISPEPEERETVVAAVEALLSADGTPAAYRSAWRASGICENVEDGADQGDGGRPRSSPGPTRA
jgi:hypothetical protein